MSELEISIDHETDYTVLKVRSITGRLFGEGEYEMKTAGKNFPASCYLELSSGILIKIVSKYDGAYFILAREPKENWNPIENFTLTDKAKVVIKSESRWVRMWNDYPPTVEEMLKAIEEMTLNELRLMSLKYDEIESIYNQMFLGVMRAYWEKLYKENKRKNVTPDQ